MSVELKSDHIYIDIISDYNSFNGYAKYFKQYDSPIVDNGSNYTLAIDRFNIPLSMIPIFIFSDHKTSGLYDFYTLELEYNGISTGQIGVQYFLDNFSSPPPKSNTEAYNLYYSIYTYSDMIKMINDTIITAYNKLASLVALPSPIPPFFTIDLDSPTIFAFNAPIVSFDINLPSFIKLYSNTNLNTLFDGIPMYWYGFNSPSGRDVRYFAYNLYNNIVDYGGVKFYKMVCDNGAEIFNSWNMARGFFFTSSNMNVRNEYFQGSNASELLGLPIICNFDLIYSSSSPKPLTAQYILQSPYKILDIVGNGKIDKIDLSVYWYDKFGNYYPILLEPHEAMSVRFIFQSKK
jgi:hypothetical protein